MVYCNLKEIKNNSAIYFVGTSTDDITGEVEFFKKPKNPVIIKQSSSNDLYLSMVSNIAVKYRNIFSKGEFPEKVCYER